MSDRDEELVRYVLNVAETKEQEAAWEAFNRITSELAEARDENERLRSGLETLRAAFIIAVGDRSPFAKVALNAADSALERKP